jgi:HAD superfamily hydrolase (TIGR01509 family)
LNTYRLAEVTVIRGVLLDLDGTLIDSNDAHARAWLEAMAESGFRPGYEEVRRLIGMGGEFLIPRALGIGADTGKGKRISHRRQEIFRERYLPRLKPFPRSRELLERMREAELRMVVASASKREEMEEMLEIAGIADVVGTATSGSDVEEPKPQPDIILAALGKIGLPPGEVLLLGDTPYDIESARKAGVAAVIVESGGWSGDQLAGALAVYRDAADLLAHFDSSPFAANGADG